MKLSIIICLYNTDRAYFDSCLESIRKSTLAEEDFEILVINDGSDTDYSDIIEKHGARCISTENRGIFKARILGIREAMGEYIAFVDSDDTVTFNFHRPMLDAAKTGYDIVFNDWAFHTERSIYCCRGDSTISGDFKYTGEDVLRAFMGNEGREHSFFVLWNKIFRASLLKDALKDLEDAAEGEERYNYSEDALICFYSFSRAASIRNMHTGYYLYRIHSSQSVNIISEERLYSHIKNMSQSFRLMEARINDMGRDSRLISSLLKWRELMSRTHFSHAKANKYSHLYNFIKESYNVDKLRISKYKDSSAYSKNMLLPENLREIDSFLLSLWYGDATAVSPEGMNRYMLDSIDYMKNCGKSIEISREGNAAPRPKIRLINRIIMNRFIYSAGLILFKKGSRLRAFLKKHI